MTALRRRTTVVAALLLCVAVVAQATWSSSGAGSASASATSVTQASAPSLSFADGNVSVSWVQTPLGSGTEFADEYEVRRYAWDDTIGTEAVVGHDCGGRIPNTPSPSCTEGDVPEGTWVYTVTAYKGPWAGPESTASDPITVSHDGDPSGPTSIDAVTMSAVATVEPGHGNRPWNVVVTLAMTDDQGGPVEGATATGTWTSTGTGDETAGTRANSCTTGDTGSCQVSWTAIHQNRETVTFTLDSITHASLVYTVPDPKEFVTAAKPS